MADEIPKTPKATSLFINSGNIVNWNRLKRKPNQTPTAELRECVSSTLKDHIVSKDATELQYETVLDCVHQQFKETIQVEERGELKLIVKLFLCSLKEGKDFVTEAITRVLKDLDTEFIETAIIAFPDADDISYEVILPYWQILENFVAEEKVLSIGIADLDKETLEKLYDSVKVKPVINQVNLESCCVMPKDLVEYAKSNDIQLLTHNDPKDLIPVETFEDVIRQETTERDGDGWEPAWVLRYSTLVKCRGIIKSKGYLLKAVRDKKRK